MAKRVIWKHNSVVSLKLRDDLYTLGQMLGRAAMRFYDIRKESGDWRNVDLNNVKSLFTLFIGNVVLHKLVDGKVSDKCVKSNDEPCERYWISARLNFEGGYPFKGGDLIDIGTDGSIGASKGLLVKENLSLPEDREVIEKYELTNMWGDADVRDRLLHFFDSGQDRDFLKEKVFPGYRS